MTFRVERLFAYQDPSRPQRVVIEDDDRVAYAYLLRGETIVSMVWLYNVGTSPVTVDPEDTNSMPFQNPAKYCSSSKALPRLSARSPLRCEWSDSGVSIFLDNRFIARLEAGVEPGWSILAAKNGPLAKRLA
jgi:hypothetical protein